MSAWIELHQSLPSHRKTLRLQSLLKLRTPQAVGHLCLLWLWALDNAPQGDLSALSPRELATVCGYSPAKAQLWLDALVEAGFLDREGQTLRIHDWDDYAGQIVYERIKNRERKRRYREQIRKTGSKKDSDDLEAVPGTVPKGNGTVPECVPGTNGTVPPLPNPTEPNPTEPDPTEPDPTLPEEEENPFFLSADRSRAAMEMILRATKQAAQEGRKGDSDYIIRLYKEMRRKYDGQTG